MELRRMVRNGTGVVAATLGLAVVAGCGQTPEPAPQATVKAATTLRELPSSTKLDIGAPADEASRARQQAMRLRMAELKDGGIGTR